MVLEANITVQISNAVKGNHSHGKYSGENVIVQDDLSLFLYPNLDEALKALKLMDKNMEFVKTNFQRIILGKSATKSSFQIVKNPADKGEGAYCLLIEESDSEEAFYLVTEKLFDIEWVTHGKKLYQQEDKASYGLGTGKLSVLPTNEFQERFGSTLNFLRRIHNNPTHPTYHGRIREGIFFRRDKSICFANFDTGAGLSLCEGIVKDLNDLSKLIKEDCQGIEMFMPVEYKDFQERVSNLPKEDNFDKLMTSACFIYNHPLFWTNDMTCSFISKVWKARNRYTRMFKSNFNLMQVGNWWESVPTPNKSSEAARYWFNLYHRENDSKSFDTSQYYGKNYKLSNYIRNALDHPEDEDEDIRLIQFKLIWPKAILSIFEELEYVTTCVNFQDMLLLQAFLRKGCTPFEIYVA